MRSVLSKEGLAGARYQDRKSSRKSIIHSGRNREHVQF